MFCKLNEMALARSYKNIDTNIVKNKILDDYVNYCFSHNFENAVISYPSRLTNTQVFYINNAYIPSYVQEHGIEQPLVVVLNKANNLLNNTREKKVAELKSYIFSGKLVSDYTKLILRANNATEEASLYIEELFNAIVEFNKKNHFSYDVNGRLDHVSIKMASETSKCYKCYFDAHGVLSATHDECKNVPYLSSDSLAAMFGCVIEKVEENANDIRSKRFSSDVFSYTVINADSYCGIRLREPYSNLCNYLDVENALSNEKITSQFVDAGFSLEKTYTEDDRSYREFKCKLAVPKIFEYNEPNLSSLVAYKNYDNSVSCSFRLHL